MSAQKFVSTLITGLLLLSGPAAMSAGAETSATTHQSTETVHMIVGHSFVLDTQVPLKRIYVGNPTVLLSYTASATEIVLTAKETGSSSLMVWDTSGSSKLYTVEADLDPSAVEDALKVEYPKEPITATVAEDHISLSGNVSTKEVAEGALKLAGNYSKFVASSLRVTGHPQEVKLKVRILEVDRTKLEQFGVNLLSMGKTVGQTGTQQFSSSAISTLTSGGTGSSVTASIANPLNFFLYSTEYNVGLSVADLASHNVLQILAEPTLTSMSGVPASFLSGGEFPFPTVQASAGSAPVVTVSFRPYGIKVDFTPTVNDDKSIRLKVAPEVSSLDYTNEVEISGYTIPGIATRRAQTEIELKSGQSFAISGLLDHQTTESFSRTPGIASIPILGELFKSKNNTHSVTELIVIVTADLVDPENPEPVTTPKMSVPNLEEDQFDKQMKKNKAADPNENQDTGKATTPVAPQNQAASQPTQTATAVPTATPSAQTVQTATAAPSSPFPTRDTGVSNPSAVVSEGNSTPSAPASVQENTQQPAAISAGTAPPSAQPAESAPVAGPPATTPKLHLRMPVTTASN